ncbi:aminoglycoside phosphotransferase (APT) family kinase protein [Sphingomonas jejuensis]|uniref:Aminoglycoside phosphotransferase (APT) family kinase protein n=1 Tax=Sphingomonas jejuensis TaxID=904715 RepID=A0ABX0XIT7_9SPHN|nr:phosphotransferase family protein [Sphingomonas jejuensis]NJC33150.1 aminoglycoside phosphotransferase (APT) family kinase protein [Sphingomonas jejuensis]
MSDLNEAALSRWMAATIAGFDGEASATKFSGGQSNPTYRIDAGGRAYVLRRKPFGPVLPSAHAVDREHRLMTALHPTGFPVPRPLGLCMDESVIGAPFFVMELVDGRTEWAGQLPALSPDARRDTYHAMIDTLARLHAIDPEAVGLGDYGRAGNYFARQVERWTKQYRAAETEHLPAVERLIDWLPRTVPDQTRTAIIHGDYRLDNLILAPDRPQVAAVIDWELSTIGDPLADFAYLAMNWEMPVDGRAGLGGLDLAGTGIPTLDEAVDRYAAATGRSGLPDLRWYFAFNLFRFVGIIQGICKRAEQGNASSSDAGVFKGRVEMLAEAGWQQAERAGA